MCPAPRRPPHPAARFSGGGSSRLFPASVGSFSAASLPASAILAPPSFQYLGSWTTDRVKGRVIEILFSWTVWFPEDIKIRDAYQMLKKQGRTPGLRCVPFSHNLSFLIFVCFDVFGKHWMSRVGQ